MSATNPAPGRIIKKANYTKGKRNILGWALLIICSPILLLVDAVRPQGSKKIIYANIWLMLIVFILIAALYFFTETKASQLERLLGGYFSFSEATIPVSSEIQEIIYENAIISNVSPQLVMAVIQVESSFNPVARSSKGACGLMQITPLVWKHYNPNSKCDGRHLPGSPDHGKDCIYNIETNITTGVRYLKDLISYYQGEIGRALEAYNAGLTNVDLERIRPKYRETRVYLQRIGRLLAPDSRERFLELYNFKMMCKTIFHWLLFLALILWAILLFWVIKRLNKTS